MIYFSGIIVGSSRVEAEVETSSMQKVWSLE
jgi:hypothetical protein